MIYFMQSTDGGAVKIGFTSKVEQRHRQLEARYGCPLAILATMPGDEKQEAEIHERFAHLRLGRTEQFRPGPDLMEFIGRPLLVGINPDAVEAMQDTTIDQSGRDDATVKVDRTLVGKAKLVATHRGIPVAELLTDLLRVPLDRAYAQMLRDLEGGM